MPKLNFEQELVLENDVVALRPLRAIDYQMLLPFALQEPTLWMYSLQSADGPKNMRNYIDSAMADRKILKSYPFIVFDKRWNEYAGSTRYYDYNNTHNTVQLGFTWYGKKYQGTGLNKNCKYLILEHAFEILGLDRVEFRADNNNQRSIAAMKSLGCKVEGVLRSNCTSPTGRRDSIVLSILRDEWFDSIKEGLALKCHEENLRFNALRSKN